MKYSTMIKSIAGASLVLGSMNAVASVSGGWSHDSHTGTYVNANAPSSSSTDSGSAMKSKKGSEFASGVTQNSNTGTLMNARVPSHEKQSHGSSRNEVTLNSFGGGAYQDRTTGTLTLIN
jgi:hypothetical protein